MKLKNYFIIGAGIGLASLTIFAAAVRNGTSVLHFNVQANFTNTGAVTNAAGSVKLDQNQQGNANNQRVDLAVRNLAPDTAYTLWVRAGDDTNFVEAVQFTTDANGTAKVNYMSVGSSQGNGNGKGKGKGKGKQPLPASLDPLYSVKELAVSDTTDTNAVAVLVADITAPLKLQYLIKRNLTNDGADADAVGSIQIKATTAKSQFRLDAAGLDPATDYFLVLNGGISQTTTTDAAGNLRITSWLVAPADVLDVSSLSLWNSTSNSVLSTQLP